ncbi:MAG: ribosome silencing factor [Peptococcaceae bacterium]|nr:ribosome silencing factor [Peptococcaceae bacterium]
MNSKEMALVAARAMDAKKGSKIKVLKLEDLTLVTDYFIVATGNSRAQTQALADAVEKKFKEDYDIQVNRIEGFQEGRWILLDYGQIIVHIFQEDERNFYNLERLWADAPCLPDTEVFPEGAAGEVGK